MILYLPIVSFLILHPSNDFEDFLVAYISLLMIYNYLTKYFDKGSYNRFSKDTLVCLCTQSLEKRIQELLSLSEATILQTMQKRPIEEEA